MIHLNYLLVIYSCAISMDPKNKNHQIYHLHPQLVPKHVEVGKPQLQIVVIHCPAAFWLDTQSKSHNPWYISSDLLASSRLLVSSSI